MFDSQTSCRVVQIFTLAVNVLEDEENALDWLLRPKLALNQQSPLSLLQTKQGAREVETLLKQIECGVYS